MTATPQTPAMAKLMEEVLPWSHPEYPLLDRHYSPNSLMPAVDFTLWVRDRLLENDEESLQQLMQFIGNGTEEWIRCVQDFCAWRVPGFEGSPVLEAELRASMMLCYRAGQFHSLGFTWANIWAVVLAAHDEALPSGVFAEKMALGSPTLRWVVMDEWQKGRDALLRVNWSLGYGERSYGCCEEWNQHFGEWLGLFEAPSAATPFPASFLTKSGLREEAALQGVVIDDKQKKDAMYAEFVKHPSLVAAVWAKHGQEFLVWRREVIEDVRDWAEAHRRSGRTVPQYLKEAAMGFLSFQNGGLPDSVRTRLLTEAGPEGDGELFKGPLDAKDRSIVRNILETHQRMSFGRRDHSRGVEPGEHSMFPAMEIIASGGDVPVEWAIRWAAAGGPPLAGVARFVAPKGHPVWSGLGDTEIFADALGVNYRPFWAGFEGYSQLVGRSECERLGILEGRIWHPYYDSPGCEIPAPEHLLTEPVSLEKLAGKRALLQELLERSSARLAMEEDSDAQRAEEEASLLKRAEFVAAVGTGLESFSDPVINARMSLWLERMRAV